MPPDCWGCGGKSMRWYFSLAECASFPSRAATATLLAPAAIIHALVAAATAAGVSIYEWELIMHIRWLFDDTFVTTASGASPARWAAMRIYISMDAASSCSSPPTVTGSARTATLPSQNTFMYGQCRYIADAFHCFDTLTLFYFIYKILLLLTHIYASILICYYRFLLIWSRLPFSLYHHMSGFALAFWPSKAK